LAITRAFYSQIYDNKSFLEKKYELTKDKVKLFDRVELIKASNNKNEILINYTNSLFKRISFLDIYDNKFNKNDIKDKIVII
jgi:CHASE2 domain-containing sensor protein